MPDETTLRFLSGNTNKLTEAREILGQVGFDVIPINYKIEELQASDPCRIVRDKILKAFSHSGRPLFVEHTGLYVDALNGFPGGLTQVFWNTLEAERFAALFGTGTKTGVTARTYVGYTDGRRVEIFEGEIEGNIPAEPRGSREFQWDCVFIPKGYDATFAELGEEKNEISMRRKALDKLAAFLGTP